MFKKNKARARRVSAHKPTAPVGSPKLIYGVTVGGSGFSLMRGQLGWFSSQGWDVTFVSSPDARSQMTIEREQVAFHGIPMEREIAPASDLRSLFAWILFLKRTRPDAVNVGTPKAGLLGGVAAWITRVPKRIYVVRGLRLEGAKGPLVPILWVMEWISSAVATDVVVISPSLARELLARRLVAPKKSWLIGKGSSNGVAARSIAAQANQVQKSDVRHQLGIPQDAFVVGFIGRLTKDKGITVLIDAVRSGHLAETIEVVIIGESEDPTIADKIKNLRARVHVLPWLSDLWDTLPVLDVLALPTRREGFSNVVLEAASAGIPAVTTRATGAVDSVVHGQTGFIVGVDDHVGLTAALNAYAGDPSLAKRHGVAAQLRAHQDFVPEGIWRGLESLLHGEYAEEGLTRLDRLQSMSVDSGALPNNG